MKTRIFRSPDTDYYSNEILTADGTHPDSYFAELAANGFNAVWLHARLRDITRTEVFPELGFEAASYQDKLNRLCRRAAAHGVRVFLYFTEPLAFPKEDPFWSAHPEVRGEPGTSGMDNWKETFALCSSHPSVRDFLREGMANLFKACPALGGVLLITRSEHHSHCYSHLEKVECPRCSGRSVAETVAEVVNTIAQGVHSSSPGAEVIAWNWSWGKAHEKDIIDRLDREITVMLDFERGGWKTIRNERRFIDEYSLSYVGPSEQFQELYGYVRKKGLDVLAKLQIGTTHEIATVNNLPLIPNLLGKARWLASHEVSGFLGTWNFGNRFSLNTYAFNRFMTDKELKDKSDDTALKEVALGYFGADVDTDTVVGAWKQFVRAFDHYPFNQSFLYFSPVNYALAYELPRPSVPDIPMQWTWIPLKRPLGTRLIESVDTVWGKTGYTLADIRDAFGEIADMFAPGLASYGQALANSANPHAVRELKNARIILHICESVRNIYAAYIIARHQPFDKATWNEVARRELRNMESVLPLLRGETEIGYHIEAPGWFFTEKDVMDKIKSLSAIRDVPAL